ncbi:Isoflavone reductase-like protein [Thalictrum thalictroides]|uniref:Isoflavone reductase-like protein n=1 Tax=Thalictrum thalictroides TaxID=46969 RepID=A0A7J6VCI0_THATH|nr:Isoflavone reductase-like protein [Thalictrum thalictroides]
MDPSRMEHALEPGSMDPSRIVHALEPGSDTFDKKMVVRKAIEDARFPFTCVSANCFGVFFICNLSQMGPFIPYTREYKTVEFAKEFVFDRYTAYGFGYEPITEDYKLVLFVTPMRSMFIH